MGTASVRPSSRLTTSDWSVQRTSITGMKSGALVLEVGIPALQQNRLIVGDDPKYVTKFLPSKSARPSDSHRLQPAFCDARLASDVSVRGPTGVGGVHEECAVGDP